MFWILQTGLFKPSIFNQLVGVLVDRRINHVILDTKLFEDTIGTDVVMPDTTIHGPLVYTYGSTKLSQIANERNWFPGGFHDEDTFRFQAWKAGVGKELLNYDAYTGPFATIKPPADGEFFARPTEDNKAFSGKCFYAYEFMEWRDHAVDSKGIYINANLQRVHTCLRPATEVMISPFKHIRTEYRFFVVDGEVITGSRYKHDGRIDDSADIPPDVMTYARKIAEMWEPERAFVVDIADSEDGLKVIEYNTIGCSGMYAADVGAIVTALEAMEF